jgi:hypothetical protein
VAGIRDILFFEMKQGFRLEAGIPVFYCNRMLPGYLALRMITNPAEVKD